MVWDDKGSEVCFGMLFKACFLHCSADREK